MELSLVGGIGLRGRPLNRRDSQASDAIAPTSISISVHAGPGGELLHQLADDVLRVTEQHPRTIREIRWWIGTMNDDNERKAATEREVFAVCIKAGSLALDPGSTESRKPPQPDIRGTVGGRARRVEMVAVTDRKLAANRTKAIKGHRVTGTAFSAEDPLFYAVASKYEKAYETGGEPLFLIAYYDKQYPSTSVDPELILVQFTALCS